jgi:Ni/Co efflux regulator RcnB
MRNLLLTIALGAVTAPAVALAADDGSIQVGGAVPTATEERAEARQRAELGQRTLDRRRERAEKRRAEARAQRGGGAGGGGTAVPGHLQAIAQCESGGNPRAIGGGGAYRGKYQFDRGTWASVGGTGDPAAAPEAEQDGRAQALMAQRGTAPWPVCG